MKSFSLFALLSATLISGIEAPAQTHAAADPITSQVCLNTLESETPACFIEVLEQGRSRLFTTASEFSNLIFEESLSELNLEFEVIPDTDYQEKFGSEQPTTYVIAENATHVYDFPSATSCASGGSRIGRPWWGPNCPGVRRPGATNSPWGGAVGRICDEPVTTAFGAVAGRICNEAETSVLGAAAGRIRGVTRIILDDSECSSQMYVHFDGATYDVSESQSWRPVRRCNR